MFASRVENKITSLVHAFVTQSYFAVVDGNADGANEYMLRANELRDAYMKRVGGNQRIEIPPLDEMKRVVRDAMLGPNSGLTPEEKARYARSLAVRRRLLRFRGSRNSDGGRFSHWLLSLSRRVLF